MEEPLTVQVSVTWATMFHGKVLGALRPTRVAGFVLSCVALAVGLSVLLATSVWWLFATLMPALVALRAGVMALSSWLPRELAASLARRPELEQLPVFVAHGSEDPMLPVAMGQASRDSLLQLGVPATYREYAMGHEVRPELLRDVVEWLESKVLSPIQLV